MSELIYREADVNEILPLRYAVLCSGRPWAEAMFVGDAAATTHHFGAFLPTARGLANVGCVSYMLNEHGGEPAWQLRGMATRPDYARQGVGANLVAAAQFALQGMSPIRLFWCKARVVAFPFYEKLGWQFASEMYVIEHYGPHRSMVKRE